MVTIEILGGEDRLLQGQSQDAPLQEKLENQCPNLSRFSPRLRLMKCQQPQLGKGSGPQTWNGIFFHFQTILQAVAH